MSAPRYIDPTLSHSFEEVRKAAILDDADEAIRSLHTHVREGNPDKCTRIFLRFPFETSKELRYRGFEVNKHEFERDPHEFERNHDFRLPNPSDNVSNRKPIIDSYLTLCFKE